MLTATLSVTGGKKKKPEKIQVPINSKMNKWLSSKILPCSENESTLVYTSTET